MNKYILSTIVSFPIGLLESTELSRKFPIRYAPITMSELENKTNLVGS